MSADSWTGGLGGALALLGERLGHVLPRALLAGVLLLVGWLLARLLRLWVARGVERLGRLVGWRPVEGGLRHLGVERSLGDVLGSVAFWGVLLIFVAAAGSITSRYPARLRSSW